MNTLGRVEELTKICNCRTQSNIWLYTSSTNETVSDMTTALLQGLPLQLTVTGALTVISSFCLHNGTNLKVCFTRREWISTCLRNLCMGACCNCSHALCQAFRLFHLLLGVPRTLVCAVSGSLVTYQQPSCLLSHFGQVAAMYMQSLLHDR